MFELRWTRSPCPGAIVLPKRKDRESGVFSKQGKRRRKEEREDSHLGLSLGARRIEHSDSDGRVRVVDALKADRSSQLSPHLTGVLRADRSSVRSSLLLLAERALVLPLTAAVDGSGELSTDGGVADVMDLTVDLTDRGLETAVRLLVLETVRSSSGRERVGLLLEAGVAKGSSRGVEGREVEVESLSAADRQSKGQGRSQRVRGRRKEWRGRNRTQR